MNVERQKLEQTLNQLHEQLSEADALDPEVADKLRHALSEIREVLIDKAIEAKAMEAKAGEATAVESSADVPSSSEPASTTETLDAAAVHFSETHPTLADTLRRLIDVLAQMGI